MQIPPCRETPLPPTHLNPEYDTEIPDVVHNQVHVDEHMPPLILVAPLYTPAEPFERVRQIAQCIDRDRMNRYLDPGSFECESSSCGYCTGDFWRQRFLIMKRLYQLNAQLGSRARAQNGQNNANPNNG